MYSASVGVNASVLQSVLIVLVIFSLDFAVHEDSIPSGPYRLNMLFLIPANTTEAVANRTAGVVLVALKTINRRQTLHGFGVNWFVEDPQCSPILAARTLMTFTRDMSNFPHAIFGGHCEKVCDILAVIADEINMPFFAIDCKENHLRNHVIFPTYLSFDYDRSSAIPVIIALMKSFGWKRLAILTASDTTNYELGLRVKSAVEANENWKAILFFTTMSFVHEGFTSPEADEEVKLVLDDIKRQARIVFFALDKLHAARILIMANRHGMHNGEYAFIGYDINTIHAALLNVTEDEWKTANVGFVYMQLTNVYTKLENHRFVDDVNAEDFNKTNQLRWIRKRALRHKDEMYIRSAGALYMAMRVYAYLVNRTLAMNGTKSIVENGELLLSSIDEHSINATKDETNVDGK